MLKTIVKGVRIAGVCASVPETSHSFMQDHSLFTEEEAKKLLATTGVYARRVAPPHICASDMCLAATEGLLEQLGWDPESIGVLIFISQDSDYVLPATACVLQKRLGLTKDCAAFDINLGCSGLIYGIWTASQLLDSSTATRALVLAGDTSTRFLKPEDRSTMPLFGDAGAAVALEKDPEAPRMFGIFGTDGSGAPNIMVKAGGRRDPLVPPIEPHSETEAARLFEDARLHLNGAEVFTFSLRLVPGLLRETMAHAGVGIDDIDYFALHQANKFMLEHLAKKSKLPREKVPIDMHDFGNTSSASVALLLCSRLGDELAARKHKLLLAGFGVGWSWGALVTDIGPIPRPTVIEIPDDFPTLKAG